MPKQKLTLPIGRGASKESIAVFLEDRADLEDFLVGDVSRHDMRATYCDESFEIRSVERAPGRGIFELEFSYEWTAYYGCPDMCRGNREFDSTTFRYWDGQLIFEKTIVGPRTTRDEF